MTIKNNNSFKNLWLLLSAVIIGTILGGLFKSKIYEYDTEKTPAPIREVKIQTYDTLTNDNAHFSKITIDSVEFIYVKYGNHIDLERLK